MLVSYQGKLWLIGGFLPSGPNLEAAASNKVLILDPAKGRWVEAPPLHHARAAGAAVVVGNEIVVFGGRTGGKSPGEVKQTEIFNGKSWHDATSIPVPGDHLGAVTDGTYVYAIGGRTLEPSANHNAVQRFDPATSKWTQLTPLPVANSDMGAAYAGGQLITFGGENGLSVSRHHPVLRPGLQDLVHAAEHARRPARDGRGGDREHHLRHRRGVPARARRIHQHPADLHRDRGASSRSGRRDLDAGTFLAVPGAAAACGGAEPEPDLAGRWADRLQQRQRTKATNKTEYYDSALQLWSNGPTAAVPGASRDDGGPTGASCG